MFIKLSQISHENETLSQRWDSSDLTPRTPSESTPVSVSEEEKPFCHTLELYESLKAKECRGASKQCEKTTFELLIRAVSSEPLVSA